MSLNVSNISYKKAEFGKCFSIVPDWLMSELNRLNLKGIDRLLYLCLYQHADVNTGICFPSYKILKQYTGVKNNSSIKQGLDRLINVGLVQIVKKGHYNEGVNLANTYKVNYIYPEEWIVCNR